MNRNKKVYSAIFFIVLFLLVVIFQSVFYFNLGVSFYNKKNYSAASNFFEKALILRPDNIDYRFYFVKALSELKPDYDVQKKMYVFASGKIDDGAKILANEKIKEWKANINQNIGNNYIEQAPADSKIIRWNKNSFPLRIFVDISPDLPEYYKAAAARAFNQWEDSVDFVSFVRTSKKSDAQITITFEKIPDNLCTEQECKYVAGFTRPKTSGNTLKAMDIVVYDRNPLGEYFSDKELYNTVLHELGHALGIMGHSYSTEDLMYMQNKEHAGIFAKFRSDFHYLSGNDVNTLKLLYLIEPSVTDKAESKKFIYPPIILGSKKEIALKKVEEAKDYIKSSPELSAGYINLAGAYEDLEEYNKALNALGNALDISNTDSERFVIFYNYAYIYLNLKRYDTALEYANLAKNIQASADILELISVIKNNKSLKK